MNKALNEIGKLRTEMKVGFIELENQMQAGNDDLKLTIQRTNDAMQQKLSATSQAMIATMEKFASRVESGFLAVEEALEADLHDLKSEIDSIKLRLDRANL